MVKKLSKKLSIEKGIRCPYCKGLIMEQMISDWECKFDIRHGEPVECPHGCGATIEFWSWNPREPLGDQSGKFCMEGYLKGYFGLKLVAYKDGIEYYGDKEIQEDLEELCRQVEK